MNADRDELQRGPVQRRRALIRGFACLVLTVFGGELVSMETQAGPVKLELRPATEAYSAISTRIEEWGGSKTPEDFSKNYQRYIQEDGLLVGGSNSKLWQVIWTLKSEGEKSEIAHSAGPSIAAIFRKAFEFRKDPRCAEVSRALAAAFSGVAVGHTAKGPDLSHLNAEFVEKQLQLAIEQFSEIGKR